MTQTKTTCDICKKTETYGYNRPHSLHKTKKTIKPNIQKNNGKKVCTRCLRTITRTK